MKRWLIVLWFVLAIPGWSQDPNLQDVLGVKLYYSDKVVKIAAKDLPTQWAKAPDDDVQVVLIYYDRKQNGKYLADELSAHDFYWWSPTMGFGQTNEIPAIPKDAIYKRGKWMYPDSAFLKVYNKAHNDHKWE